MLENPQTKYQKFAKLHFAARQWPDKELTHSPIWLSTDLRDGNQSLIEPMSIETKLKLFQMLVDIGFKEIEVGFPSASQTDFDFIRRLIDDNLIPVGVKIQVLTQAREDLIQRTFESVTGANEVIIHYYNAIAPSFRKIVFNQSKDGVKDLAIKGAKLITAEALKYPDIKWHFQYSPEVFSSAEPDFAVKVCNSVIDIFKPTITNKLIINLPATIESATPNCYADQIEYFCTNVNLRENLIISLHTHNDRGCAIAATELGLLAGADRVEGCLFGNGERTGNACLVTLALNLYTQGIAPKLNFSEIDKIKDIIEECNNLKVPERYPYVGSLVHTAFSGSHQDAIRKGFALQKPDAIREVPYLPIDPNDIGKSYEAIIRVNSQSGKGGIAFLLEQEFDISLPRKASIEFSNIVQKEMDKTGLELTATQIYHLLEFEYLHKISPYNLGKYKLIQDDNVSIFEGQLLNNGVETEIKGQGNGPLEALQAALPFKVEVLDYHEASIGAGTNAKAISYIELKVENNPPLYGIGIHENSTYASIKAIFSAINRAFGG
jgi:2-isopropylmalate synthase